MGYTLICAIVYLGRFDAFKYCANTGTALEFPLLKRLQLQISFDNSLKKNIHSIALHIEEAERVNMP